VEDTLISQSPDASMPARNIRRLLVSGPLAGEVIMLLGSSHPSLETREIPQGPLSDEDLQWADAYTGFQLPDGIDRSRIVWVHAMSAGVDTMVPTLRETPRTVLLTRTVGDMGRKIGLYVLTHVLADTHRLADYRWQQANHEWRRLDATCMDGAIATVLGTGAIGARVAEALQNAGFVTCGVNRTGREHPSFSHTAAAADPEAVPRKTTVLVNTLPLTPETKGSIGMTLFGRLQGTLFINVGRGASVVMDELRHALELGHLRRAVLDVLPVEPPSADAWYWEHPQVVLTPHVSAVTDAEEVVHALTSALNDLRAGLEPRDAVDLKRGY